VHHLFSTFPYSPCPDSASRSPTTEEQSRTRSRPISGRSSGGKYARRLAESTNIVVLDPQVAKAFPTDDADLAPPGDWWDNPTMTTATADAKRRVVLPAAKPGDVFDIQTQGEGRVLLVRLERPEPGSRMSKSRSLDAIAAAPLRPKMTWESLKATTREP
jgi:hypothetical protein